MKNRTALYAAVAVVLSTLLWLSSARYEIAAIGQDGNPIVIRLDRWTGAVCATGGMDFNYNNQHSDHPFRPCHPANKTLHDPLNAP